MCGVEIIHVIIYIYYYLYGKPCYDHSTESVQGCFEDIQIFTHSCLFQIVGST